MILSETQLMALDAKLQELDFMSVQYPLDYSSMLEEFNAWYAQFSNLSLPKFHDALGTDFNLDVIGIWDRTDDAMLAGEYFFQLKERGLLRSEPGPTDVGQRFFPSTCAALSTICGLGRAKLSRLPAGAIVPWHEHEKNLLSKNIVLHIPLQTNNAVINLVKINGSVSACNFTPNKLWFFASAPGIFHSVQNLSNADRWNIWMNVTVVDHTGSVLNEVIYNQIMEQ